jgi:hypothetical protein
LHREEHEERESIKERAMEPYESIRR